MKPMAIERDRILNAWAGRVSGCQLGKPVELLSLIRGREALRSYLSQNNVLPLRDYVPLGDEPLVGLLGSGSCKDYITRSEPDDDINYTVLALMMLEKHGPELCTADVASAWLRLLPAGVTHTAEKAAYKTLLDITDETAFLGLPKDFDLSACADNEWSEWIGAQIRADLYGWVCPGRPEVAAELARADASLSHTREGIHAAVFIAALAACIPVTGSFEKAVEAALLHIPHDSESAESVKFGRSLHGKADAVDSLHGRYKDLPPVHALNNLALVVWGLLSGEDDFSAAIGDVVAAGWDTDCNGATVGGLWGLSGRPIPGKWTAPWQGKIAVDIGGVGELTLDNLTERTVAVADKL